MAMKIALLNQFSQTISLQLQNNGHQVLDEGTLECADAIVLRSKSLHEVALSDSLIAVARAGAGVNNIPVEAMSQRGVAVFNAPGANANAVAEMVLTGILMQLRQVPSALVFTQALFAEAHDDYAGAMEKGKANYQGQELQSLRLGIIGLGAIGVLLANKAVALGMEVHGFDPHISVENAWRLSSKVKQQSTLDELLRLCNSVSVHVPYLPATHHLIGQKELASMSAQTILCNFSRAEVVDEVALVQALEQKKLQAYVCDFPSAALQKQANALCFPHLGASTEEAQSNASTQVVATLQRFLTFGEIRNSVNLPEMLVGPMASDSSRLLVIHDNAVGMIAQITEVIEEVGENIREMNNRSRGDVAVTLIDLDANPCAELLQAIQKIPQVRSARYCQSELLS